MIETVYAICLHLPRQAYPDAEDARPAAVGKLFTEQIWTLWETLLTSEVESPLFRLLRENLRTGEYK